MNENNVFFDVYSWNNAWGYHYKGHLILLNGTVLQYELPQEAGFTPSLSYKLNYTMKVKTLSDEMLKELHTLFDPIKSSCIKDPVQKIYDAHHICYYGYHSVDHRIFLRERATFTCDYTGDMQKRVDKLILLINTCIKPRNELTCAQCGADGAKAIVIEEEERDNEDVKNSLSQVQVYCDEECRLVRLQYDKKRRRGGLTRMMHSSNGRKSVNK